MYRVLVLLCWALPALAAFERGGELNPGPGLATVAVPGTPWTAFTNPAGLSSITSRTLALSHTPRPFGLNELARSALAYIEPLPFGTAGMTLQRYGFELYREITAGFQFATRVNGAWEAGLGIHYYALSIPGYGSAGAVGIDAGIALELTDEIRAGCSALNINGPAIGADRERLPQVLSLGFCFIPMRGMLLALDLTKDVRFPPGLHAALEYSPLPVIRLFGGSGTEPSSFRAGAVVTVDPVQAGYGFSTHPDLGGTHHFSLVMALDLF